MTEPWLLQILLFAVILLGVQQSQFGLSRSLSLRKRTRRRFNGLADSTSPSSDLDAFRRRAWPGRHLPFVAAFERVIMQSGTRLGIGPVLAIAAGILLLSFSLLPLSSGGVATRLLLSALIAMIVVWLVFRRMRARRMSRFGEQLPEVLDIVTRSLRAGHPLPVSLRLVAREMPEPAGPEFMLVVDEIAYGRSVSEAMDNLYRRVGYPELRFVVASTAIAQQTGGNLGEILGRLAGTLRGRFRLQRRARALSAEGRFSGYALSALPVLLFAAINVVSPVYYTTFWESPSARTVLFVCLGLMFLGNAIIFRLVNFRI